MAKINQYGVRDLQKDFPNEAKCLDFIFNSLHSKDCSCGGKYNPLKGRKQYQCSKCRYQIAPLADTIFHKSDTPLQLWFIALLMFSNAKSGISAKFLERELNVTYKTAWRMLKLIRTALGQSKSKLKGLVEMDEMYFGGKGKAGRNNKDLGKVMDKKSVVIGAVERGGKLKARKSPNAQAYNIGKFLNENIEKKDTVLLTDESNRYNNVAKPYLREKVNHKRKEYVRGYVHTNNIESFWGHVKKSVSGTHKVISRKYLQSYLDGFVFHYNNRHNDRERFAVLVNTLLYGAGF